MSTVTKYKYPIAQYHCLVSGTPMPSGLAINQIIDCTNSLGGKPAKSCIVDATNGQMAVRFNCTQDIHANQAGTNNFIAHAGFYTKPVLTATVEIPADDIVINSGFTLELHNEFPIDTIKITQLANGGRIIFS